MIARRPEPAERRRMDELFSIAFEMPLEPAPEDGGNSDRVHPWAAFADDGQMTSCLTVTDFDVHFDGSRCKMGGVGGVATLPQYRRQGGVRLCFDAALEDMYRRGCVFSYLFPFSTAFYRRFGYEPCVQKYAWTVDLGLLRVPEQTGVTLLAEASRPMAKAVEAIESAWAERFNMSVLHEPEDFRWADRADPAAKQEFTYVCFDAQGRPRAYTTFRKEDRPEGRCLTCSRFFFLDREGFWALMGLFKKLAADHRYVKFKTPAQPSLQYLLPEWNMGAARWEVLHNEGMVRIVNVEKALERAVYLGAGSAVLEIRDGQLPANNGRFALRFDRDRAVDVRRTEEPVDAALSIGAFSALLAGVCPLEEAAAWMPGLEIKNPAAPLARIFYRKPLMISDYF